MRPALLVLALLAITLLSITATAEVQQATGKILLYKYEKEYRLVIVLVVNDNTVYYEGVHVSYDPTNNLLTVETTASCYYESDIQMAAVFGIVFPASYLASLPNLRSVTVKCIDMDNNVTKTVTVDFAQLGLTARTIKYEGFNAVEVSTSSGPYPGTRIIYRDDGIMLFANIPGVQVIKLVVEDDIAKKTAAQPTQPSTTAPPITSTSTPATTTSAASPTPTATTTQMLPTTQQPTTTATSTPAPEQQTATQPAPTTPATTSEKTQGVNTLYVAVAAIAAAGLVVAAIMLKKR